VKVYIYFVHEIVDDVMYVTVVKADSKEDAEKKIREKLTPNELYHDYVFAGREVENDIFMTIIR